MSESLHRSESYYNSLTEVDHLNRFRLPDGSHDQFAVRGVYENLIPAVKEAAMPFAVSTTYQEYHDGSFWWLDQKPEDVAASGYHFHRHPAALDRVAVEVDEAHDTATDLKAGMVKVLISPRMSAKDAPYEVAKQEHLADDDMIRIHMVDIGADGQPKGKYMQSLLVRAIPLTAWVRMLRDPQNIFKKAVWIDDEESALSVMKVHKQLEVPEAVLPEGVISLVEAVLPYLDTQARAAVEQQLHLFRTNQGGLHDKAMNIANRWLSFETALADSLYTGYATEEVEGFIRDLAFQWNGEMAAEIMENTDSYGRINMNRSLAAKLEISRQNTLWVSAAVITKNERVLKQLAPDIAQQIYVNEMFLQTMIAGGASARDMQQVESQNSKAIATQNVEAGGGCPGSGKGLFGSSNNPSNGTEGGADMKCPEVKNGQRVKCPGCKEMVKAIVPNKESIYCSNGACKLAAPHVKAHKQSAEAPKIQDTQKVIKRTGELTSAGVRQK